MSASEVKTWLVTALIPKVSEIYVQCDWYFRSTGIQRWAAVESLIWESSPLISSFSLRSLMAPGGAGSAGARLCCPRPRTSQTPSIVQGSLRCE